jgi:DNA-binding GntR family transcriptional regulator
VSTIAPSERTLYDLIYSVLRDHIRRKRFPAGLVLGEAGVARAFNTSRNPAATALRQLREDGLVRDFEGRGFLVGDGPPLRLELEAAGLQLADGVRKGDSARNLPVRIYPEVEHAVASVLAYGRFLLNESALAEHYGASRAVAHEILTRLERTGLIIQDSNQRWYAGPMTPKLMREHFEIRWLLEPIALKQAAPLIGRDELLRKRGHLKELHDGYRNPQLLERIEGELHVELIERCDNTQLKRAVRRSQLPVIATHSTYRYTQDAEEIATMAKEHRTIFDRLLARNADGAAAALEAHLKRAVEHNVGLLEKLPPLPDKELPPYLARA